METAIVERFLAIGYGSGDGYGYGSGYGDGYGSGYGSGDGYGDGSGYGDGYGSGVKTFCGLVVHQIDGVATLLYSIRDNVAKGAILQSDLTLTPCYVVKGNNMFAHGNTLREAMAALDAKMFEDMPPEERCEMFMKEFTADKEYPASLFFEWHHKLTGSCEAGRKAFARDRGIDIENDKYTVKQFIEITQNAYNGEIIKLLEKMYSEATNT